MLLKFGRIFVSLIFASAVAAPNCSDCMDPRRDWYVIALSFVTGFVQGAVFVTIFRWVWNREFGRRPRDESMEETNDERSSLDTGRDEETGQFYEEIGINNDFGSVHNLGRRSANLADSSETLSREKHLCHVEPIYSGCGTVDLPSDSGKEGTSRDTLVGDLGTGKEAVYHEPRPTSSFRGMAKKKILTRNELTVNECASYKEPRRENIYRNIKVLGGSANPPGNVVNESTICCKDDESEITGADYKHPKSLFSQESIKKNRRKDKVSDLRLPPREGIPLKPLRKKKSVNMDHLRLQEAGSSDEISFSTILSESNEERSCDYERSYQIPQIDQEFFATLRNDERPGDVQSSPATKENTIEVENEKVPPLPNKEKKMTRCELSREEPRQLSYDVEQESPDLPSRSVIDTRPVSGIYTELNNQDRHVDNDDDYEHLKPM